MIWRDVIISLSPPDTILANALAEVFDVEREQINIITSVEKIEPQYLVNCVISPLSGDFSLLLSFYLGFEISGDLEIFSKISSAFFCSALVSNDESLDPYSMLLIDQSIEPRIVNIDPVQLDECEQYVIVESKA